MQEPKRYTPGITAASLLASLFALLLMAILVQSAEIVLGMAFPTEHTLAVPAIWTFVLISIVVGVVYLLSKTRLLGRAQLLCVMYVMLISAPLMTQGFWHRIISVIATNPRMGDFDKLDALNDKLWPHGPNLLEDALDLKAKRYTPVGHVEVKTLEYDKGVSAELPVLTNTKKEDISAVRIRLPLVVNDKDYVIRGEPYLVSVMIRPKDLGPDAKYFIRMYADEDTTYSEAMQDSQVPLPTFLHQTGFKRVGAYGAKFSSAAKDHVYVEFGLQGAGQLELASPKLLSVGALEGIYKGKLIVTESRLNEKDAQGRDLFPPGERANLIVKPDNMLSLRGIGFLLSGYIPVREWVVPLFTWVALVTLLLTATLMVSVIMRRQWMDNERYQMPLTRVPVALIDDEGQATAMPPIWKNVWMWSGFVVTLAWVLMKAWHYYNASVPDLALYFTLKDYLSDPSWGNMWDRVRLEINPMFLSLCIFMELGILMSIVVGFFLARAQGWAGQATGWNTNPNYPWPVEQSIGSFITYGVLVLILARKYLWFVLVAAFRGDKKASEGEIFSYRTALIVLVCCFLGAAAWAAWLGISIGGMMLFFTFLLLIGFVSAKLRAEAGLPWGYFAPGNLAIVLTLLGGVSVFGPQAVIFSFIASFCFAQTPFFLIPGAQLEVVELGRRWNVRPSHILFTVLLAIIGGMVLGGWTFLSNSYSWGGETMRYGWAYDTKWWYFFSYNQQMTAATNAMNGAPAGVAPTGGIDPVWYAYAYAVVGTTLITLLRQMFSGFWFHPIGFILGPTVGWGFLEYVWGSALAAWVIRGTVLWLGGATTVRRKLQPFFIGVFLGSCAAELLIGIHTQHLKTIGIERVFPTLTP